MKQSVKVSGVGEFSGRGVEGRPAPLAPLLAVWHVVSLTTELEGLIVMHWLEKRR